MSLQVWLPLNGSLENLGLDSFNFTQSIASGYEDGKIGKALQMKNSNIIFTVPSLVDAKVFSVAFWYKAIVDSSITTNWNKVIRFNTKNADGTSGSDFRFESSYAGSYATANYALSVHNNTTQSLGSIGHEIVNSKGAWHHICFTHTPDDNYTYLDGVQIRYGTGAAGTLTGRIIIAGASPYPNGLMNDLRIYDHALSQKEVKDLSKGLVAHYPLNDFVGNPNLVLSNQNRWYLFNGNHTLEHTNDGVKMTVTTAASNGFMIPFASDNALVGGETFTLAFKYKTNISNFSKLYLMCRSGGNKMIGLSTNYYSPNEWKTFSFTSSFPSTSGQATHAILIPYTNVVNSWIEIKDNTLKLEKGSVPTPWLPNTQDDLYSAMGLDDGVVYDCSGYRHNGTFSPTLPSINSDSARYSSCMKFNGSNNYIDLGIDTWLPTDAVTVSVWAYMDTWGSSRIISCTEGGGWNFEAGEGGGWRFPVYKNGIGYCYAVPAKKWADYTSGWHYIVGTFDGYVSRIYIDGELDSISTNATPGTKALIKYNQNAKLFIGCEANTASPSAPYFPGKISDVRIYCTALSTEDIKALYETSVSIDDKGNFHSYEISEV